MNTSVLSAKLLKAYEDEDDWLLDDDVMLLLANDAVLI